MPRVCVPQQPQRSSEILSIQERIEGILSIQERIYGILSIQERIEGILSIQERIEGILSIQESSAAEAPVQTKTWVREGAERAGDSHTPMHTHTHTVKSQHLHLCGCVLYFSIVRKQKREEGGNKVEVELS